MEFVDIYDANQVDWSKVFELAPGISQKLIKDWINQREKIESSRGKLTKRRLSGGGRKPLSKELDEKVKFF